MRKKVYKISIPDKQELIEGYLEKKRLSGISKFTYDDHEGTLRRFFQFYSGQIADDAELENAVRGFLVNKKNEHYDKILQVLRGFFNYCIDEEVIKGNPTKGLKYKPHSVRIVDHDKDTIMRLLKLPDKKRFVGYRDYVFMLLMLDCGVRPYEALQLRIRDVQNCYVRIREEVAKTRKERVLPISFVVSQAIKKLVNSRHDSWDKENGYIFCSFTGSKLTSRHIQLRFRGYSKTLGVTVTSYHLRHIFALYYIRNGGDVFSLQQILGHQNLNMSQVYVNLVQTDIRNGHTKATPIKIFLEDKKRMTRLKK